MTLQALVGQGAWYPSPILAGQAASQTLGASDTGLIDADTEEYQIIGDVMTDDGAAHVFGNSGSAIDWLPGPVTFNVVSTVRVGIKQASSIDTANGPPARATVGLAAFDVYKDLVAGVDTITTATAQSTAMATLLGGTITITPGDQCAICFYLNKPSGTSSVVIRQVLVGTAHGYPAFPLFTGTYVNQGHNNTVMLKFDDGHYGWIFPTSPVSVLTDASSANIGNTNIFANIFNFPFKCKVNAMLAWVSVGSATANFAFDAYSTPLGTPSQILTLPFDSNQINTGRQVYKVFSPSQQLTLSANTDYAFGVRQTTATVVSTMQRDVFATGHWPAIGGNSSQGYAATSTAGATFAASNANKRRFHIWINVSALSDDAGGGGGNLNQWIGA